MTRLILGKLLKSFSAESSRMDQSSVPRNGRGDCGPAKVDSKPTKCSPEINEDPLSNLSLSEKQENLLIEDTLVMDQLEKLRHNVDELTLTAKSRARVASEVGTAFEPQDRLFMRTVERFRTEITQLLIQERNRYHECSYGTFEKSRRYAMYHGLQKVTDRLNLLLNEQDEILRTEYELHERQLELLSSTFEKREDESAKTAAEYLRKMKTKYSAP